MDDDDDDCSMASYLCSGVTKSTLEQKINVGEEKVVQILLWRGMILDHEIIIRLNLHMHSGYIANLRNVSFTTHSRNTWNRCTPKYAPRMIILLRSVIRIYLPCVYFLLIGKLICIVLSFFCL